ncbi:unnamed protein product [Rotaria sordida]|uniref:Uncharacterized protein n=1 Tax=Rotaria sordida TaxID=392033 RepID=A0A816C4S5_9BILA|nr:unnamed protein product [Rotaria sordida]
MYKRSHQVNWDHAPKFIDWYPSKTQDKRDSYCCTGSGEIPYPEMILMVVVVSFWCSIVICACVAICSPNHPVINNDFNMMSLQQSTQSRPFLMSSMTTVQNMNTANLNLIEPTPRNSIVSTEQPPPECNNYNIRVATTNEIEQLIPDAPPAYDALVQSNSTTIIIEQHNLPPPTYDDFIRKNNAKWRKMNNF